MHTAVTLSLGISLRLVILIVHSLASLHILELVAVPAIEALVALFLLVILVDILLPVNLDPLRLVVFLGEASPIGRRFVSFY